MTDYNKWNKFAADFDSDAESVDSDEEKKFTSADKDVKHRFFRIDPIAYIPGGKVKICKDILRPIDDLFEKYAADPNAGDEDEEAEGAAIDNDALRKKVEADPEAELTTLAEKKVEADPYAELTTLAEREDYLRAHGVEITDFGKSKDAPKVYKEGEKREIKQSDVTKIIKEMQMEEKQKISNKSLQISDEIVGEDGQLKNKSPAAAVRSALGWSYAGTSVLPGYATQIDNQWRVWYDDNFMMNDKLKENPSARALLGTASKGAFVVGCYDGNKREYKKLSKRQVADLIYKRSEGGDADMITQERAQQAEVQKKLEAMGVETQKLNGGA